MRFYLCNASCVRFSYLGCNCVTIILKWSKLHFSILVVVSQIDYPTDKQERVQLSDKIFTYSSTIGSSSSR